jgi:hypothetical protein
MSRGKRNKPIEFNPEPPKGTAPVVSAPNDPDPMPETAPAPAPESDSGENPPRLDSRGEKEAGEGPSGPSEPSKGGDGRSDVEGAGSGSESVLPWEMVTMSRSLPARVRLTSVSWK